MKRVKEEMEGGYRLNSIRRVKKTMYVVQTVVFLVLAFYVMWMDDELSISPLQFGLPTLMFFLVALLFILNLESFVFLRLEVRYIRSFSTKYYMTRSSIRRSLVIMIIAAIALLAFWSPLMDGAANGVMQVEETKLVSGASPQAVSFMSSDMLSITGAGKLTVMSDAGKVLVLVVSEENYDLYASQGSDRLGGFRINTNTYSADPGMEFTLPGLEWGKYYVVVYLDGGSGGNVQVTISSVMAVQWYSFLPFFAVAFIIANGLWVLYIRSMHNMFRQRAIYR